jgi:hypothetical protein
MLGLKRFTDDERADSLSNRLRARRFQVFEDLVRGLPRPLRIIDVGGTTEFWEHRGWAGRSDVQITMVNLKQQPSKYPNITSTVGDATTLEGFADRSFEVAFSNSVIEHLFTRENQAAMARQIRRVATAYWVQTPNYWFPIEPHFHVPGWQWAPVGVRVAILRRRACGWRGRTPDPQRARKIVTEVRLLTRRELLGMFPDATILGERLFGLNKSWIVYGGFGRGQPGDSVGQPTQI